MPIRLHEEDPALFAEAIGFTSAETGFIASLIEKDYYCSVLLEDLGSVVRTSYSRAARCWRKYTLASID